MDDGAIPPGAVVLHADADLFPHRRIAEKLIRDAGFSYVPVPSGDSDELARLAPSAAALMCSKSLVTPELISLLTRCRVITRLGSGVDNVDVVAARAAEIAVTYVPDFCTTDVAEHAIGLLMACEHRIVAGALELRAGGWPRHTDIGPSRRLAELRLGIVGFGRIGRRVAQLARCLGMEVVAYDPAVAPGTMEASGVQGLSDTQLLGASDVISLHLPLNGATRHWLDAGRLAVVRHGVTILNTSRGGLVDEEALFEALVDGRVAAVGLDVFESEPPTGSDLIAHERAVCTPHIAAHSDSALTALFTDGAADVVSVLSGRPPLYPYES